MMHRMAGPALAFLLVAVVGCGGAQKKSTAAGPTCADAAANAEKVILALGQAQGQDMAMMATAGRETYAERCAADGWSAAIVSCAAAAPDADAIQACVEQLTPEQHQAMEETFGAKMGGPAAGSATDPCGGDE